MLEIPQKISTWIEQVDFQNEEQNLASFYVQIMALIIITGTSLICITYAFAGEVRYVMVMAANVVIDTLVIVLIRRKFLQAGSTLFMVANLASETYGLLSGGGIHSSSSIIFPVLLIFASLLLERKNFITYTLLCITCIGLVIIAENRGLTPPYVPDPPELPLFITYCLIIILSGILIRFITENLQNSLKKSRQRENELAIQSEILNRVGQAVVACKDDNTIIFWNSAASKYYGWQASDTLGKNYADMVPVSYSEGSMEEIQAALRSGQTWSGEIKVKQRDGNILPILGTISPLHNHAGTRFGWIGTAADIHELKDSQNKVISLNAELEIRVQARTAELETVLQELESFSYSIGHDLRAPLRGMNGFSKMILDDHADSLPEDVRDKLVRVEGAAKAMGELVDALLNFSRLTRITLHCSQVNLSGLVKNAIDAQQLKFGEMDLTSQVAENVYAHADPGLMQTVIDHLIDNACKFTSKTRNAHIEFGVKQEEGKSVYFIQDNGAGFDMAYSQKLFQPFHRLHHPDEFPGHGIGLVIAQRIIHRHGGTIWAEAQPNRGATFYFTLN